MSFFDSAIGGTCRPRVLTEIWNFHPCPRQRRALLLCLGFVRRFVCGECEIALEGPGTCPDGSWTTDQLRPRCRSSDRNVNSHAKSVYRTANEHACWPLMSARRHTPTPAHPHTHTPTHTPTHPHTHTPTRPHAHTPTRAPTHPRTHAPTPTQTHVRLTRTHPGGGSSQETAGYEVPLGASTPGASSRFLFHRFCNLSGFW